MRLALGRVTFARLETTIDPPTICRPDVSAASASRQFRRGRLDGSH